MSELKPCPFCGGEVESAKTHPNPVYDWGGRYGTTVWEVYCPNAECCEVSTGWRNTEAEAIEAWNTRHMPPCETCPQIDNPDSFIFHLLQVERRVNDVD